MSRRNAAARGRRLHLELDEEPALSQAEGLRRLDRRRISGRWLVSTILTGIAGACLLGGALYASLDRQSSFAEAPRIVAGKVPAEAAPHRKSDRLAMQAAGAHPVKQLLRIDTVTRVGDKEYVKVRPFMRISAPLALTRTALTAKLPPFNPFRLFAAADEPLRAAPPKPEGEIAFTIRDFDEKAKLAPAEPPAAELHALVREAAQFGAHDLSRTVSAFAPADGLFGATDPLAASALGFGAGLPSYGSAVRAWTENVTMVAKSARAEAPASNTDDRVLIVQKGDKLANLLMQNGATPAEAQSMMEIIGERFPPEKLREGMRLRLTMSAAEDDRTRLRPVRVSIYDGDEHKASVALSDTGGYVGIEDPGDFTADPDSLAESDDEDEAPTPSLYVSLYETAFKLELPKSLVDSLVRIYSYDVDFQRRVEPGDSFEVFYGAEGEEILYAALTLRGDTRRYYRFQDPGDDAVDYYDDTGRSAKKFLIQKPVAGGSISSGFGIRRHPILGYAKLHTGVDWRAPRGTPIVASGNGTIEKAGWDGGYGRYIRIRHANGYETGYGHMSGFAKGIAPGVRVRQGQVIGYVGSTGLSTGTHVHYEVLINDRFVNPLSIKVPRGRTLEGNALAEFMRERARIDSALGHAPASARL